MKFTPKFSGSIVALVSPMQPGGAIDWDSLQALIEWHIESKSDGIVAVGTTGESPTLTHSEHQEFIKRTIEMVNSRIPVIAGTGANSTQEAIDLTKAACDDGADANLSVVPYYNKPTQGGLIKHFEAIANASSKPVILYNVPGRTITDLGDDAVITLSEHEMIQGIKDATANMDRLKFQMANIKDSNFSFISGDDASALEYIQTGGHGVISVTANIAPSMFANMIRLALAGDYDKAKEINEKLTKFNKIQAIEANPIPVKWALAQTKRIKTGIRLPLTELSAKFQQEVLSAISNIQ